MIKLKISYIIYWQKFCSLHIVMYIHTPLAINHNLWQKCGSLFLLFVAIIILSLIIIYTLYNVMYFKLFYQKYLKKNIILISNNFIVEIEVSAGVHVYLIVAYLIKRFHMKFVIVLGKIFGCLVYYCIFIYFRVILLLSTNIFIMY